MNDRLFGCVFTYCIQSISFSTKTVFNTNDSIGSRMKQMNLWTGKPCFLTCRITNINIWSEICHMIKCVIESNARLKSINTMYSGLRHSIDCSTIILSVLMWSVHDLFGQKPACSFRIMVSSCSKSLLVTTRARILLMIFSRVAFILFPILFVAQPLPSLRLLWGVRLCCYLVLSLCHLTNGISLLWFRFWMGQMCWS